MEDKVLDKVLDTNYVMIFEWDNQLTQLPPPGGYPTSTRFKKVKRLLSLLIKFVL